VELFPAPVAGFESAVDYPTSHASASSNPLPQDEQSAGDRFVSFAVCLAVAGIATVPAFLLAGAALVAEFFVCGDNPPSSCGPHLSSACSLLCSSGSRRRSYLDRDRESASCPAPGRIRTEAAVARSFSLRTSLSPNPVSYGSYPTLYAFSSPGAVCTASVLYSTGRVPLSFNGSSQTVGGSGKVGWSWRMESKGSSGTRTVTCTLRGQSKNATATFTIA
jgi:hypothetical protein